jgi:CheY-like chemotaxis protein
LARKILLADDSVTAQNMGRRILSDAGYDVTTVNNGSAALKKIAESKPDLIVLDVYMPGYGGLEVCQRLREAPETARIPVLLTVGKLEPFKAEEARRVRADGFLVKPFEASELLTALTKLEDKIVPQSQPSKQSRFAKALAGIEELNPSKEFGDKETGWKNRLSIPPPHSKHHETASEEPPAAVAGARQPARTPASAPAEEPQPAEMKSGLEEALLSAMPQDVTAEEIAAIKAAAAAFSAPGNESNFRSARYHVEAPTQEPVAKVEELATESVASESISAILHGEAVTAETATTAEPASTVDIPAEALASSETIVSESAALQVAAESGKLADDEVTAALASLAPANGHELAAMDREADKWERGSRELALVTMAVAGAAQEFSGPRWIAESVPPREDEATLVLEEEMEKAYAAFAAADAARMNFASSPAEPCFSSPVAEVPATQLEAPSSPAESLANADSSESEAALGAVAPSEESIVPEAEVSPVAAPSIVDAVSVSAVSDGNESMARAAAASASPSTAEATLAEASGPAAESSESVRPALEPNRRQGESELAAAWANWKQIREPVAGPQISDSQISDSQINDSQISDSQINESRLGAQIADTVAELTENSSVAQPESQADGSPATEEETSEISSIVDSVLADLKPKLMAEIARKMGKGKKR